jgi:hypothetical protein
LLPPRARAPREARLASALVNAAVLTDDCPRGLRFLLRVGGYLTPVPDEEGPMVYISVGTIALIVLIVLLLVFLL